MRALEDLDVADALFDRPRTLLRLFLRDAFGLLRFGVQLVVEREAPFLAQPERVTDPKITDRVAYTQRLADYIADRRITMEVCITSNLQTNPAIPSAKAHALRWMLDQRLSVALCTDNRLVSHTDCTNELGIAVEECGVNHRELRDIVIHGFKRSFYPGSYIEKRTYVRQVIDCYDRVIETYAAAAR